MSKYKVPVTPENYAVWYKYVSGGNLALTQVIDELVEDEQSISEEVTSSLYKRFFDPVDYAPLVKAQQVFHRLADRVTKTLNLAAIETADYGASLKEVTTKISADVFEEHVRSVLGVLTLVTTQMTQGNRTLQESLDKSRIEAEGLRDELEKVKTESLKDGLTGLSNRKSFHAELEKLQEQVDALANTCMIFADIDHFKQVNDEFGHLFGDKVITAVAKVLEGVVGSKGLPCRYGGEEFAVLLPKTNIKEAVSLAEEIRESVERGRVINPQTGQKLGEVTISAGVSSFAPEVDIYETIETADTALYRAKNNGRNRVELG